MGRVGLAMAVLTVLLGGCLRQGEPADRPAPASTDRKKPMAAGADPRLARQLFEIAAKDAARHQVRGAAGLPLVIRIEPPEPPPEIEKPSPPIQEQPKPP